MHAFFLTLFICSCFVVGSHSDLIFFTIGDWGWRGHDQTSVAAAMVEATQKNVPDFFLALGDNFYENGVASVEDSQWQQTFEDVYSSETLNKPWYALLGNHDYHQNASAQIDFFLKKMDNRWILPDYYYTETFTVEKGVTLQIVFIDTIQLSDKHTAQLITDKVNKGELSPSNATKILQLLSTFDDQVQLRWIEETLASSKADWLIVAGHFPVYSGGEHGHTKELIRDLKPLLEKYQVDAYLSGHDHTLQYLKKNSVHYFVSGNAAKRGRYSPVSESVWGIVSPGFSVHNVTKDQMEVKFIDHTGIIYSTSIPRSRNL